MNIIIKWISAYILSTWLLSCAPSSDLSPSIPSKEEPAKRQAPLEFYNQDDFDFTQFEGIDWKKSNTFGEPCSGTCVGTTPGTLGTHSFMPDFGISADNYATISIKSDGSCWIRSATHALLFRAFQDSKIFTAIIDNIKIARVKYAQVPGFSGRFFHQELIDLLTTLNSLSPKERLAQFNKAKVDLFLDYSMRALLHAHNYSEELAKSESAQMKAKKLLTSHSWGHGSITFQALVEELWPRENLVTFLSLNNLNVDNGYVEFMFSRPRPRTIRVDHVVHLNQVLREERRTAAEIKSDCKLKKQLWKSSTDPQVARPRQVEYNTCKMILWVKQLSDQWHIKSLSEFHRIPAFSIFQYMPTGNHFELMIHKNSLKEFGIIERQ